MSFKERSNVFILSVTFGLFFSFCIAEIFGALIGHSLSLLADSASMAVDSFSYLTNLYAERLKSKGALSNNETLLLKVIVPLFSILVLIGVTVWILASAIAVIVSNPSGKSDVNIIIMYAFVTVNLFIDIISGTLFYYNIGNVFNAENDECVTSITDVTSEDIEYSRVKDKTEDPANPPHNVNMLSALSHVGADSLRTVAIYAAAIVASFGVDADLSDAWAAVIVSFTILFAVSPVILQIYSNFVEYELKLKSNRKSDLKLVEKSLVVPLPVSVMNDI